MDNQTKIIFILLAVILILGIMLGLKVTGVIKSTEKELIDLPQNKNAIEDKEEIKDTHKYDEEFSYKALKLWATYRTIISITATIINIILAIGLAKLYRKINMPDWAVTFQYFYPIITLTIGLGSGSIVRLISGIIGLIWLSCLCSFFDCLGMSKWWPLPLMTGIIFVVIGMFNKFWLILGIILILMYIYAHIISNIRLAKKFDKGILFTILLIFLPGIFQPVIGFEK